jgi:hypothetical protein
VTFPVVPEVMKMWTRCRTARGVRVRGRRRRLLLVERERSGRRSSGGDGLRVRKLASICYEIGRETSINRCARSWKIERYQREGSEHRRLVGINELLRRLLQPPAGDFGQPGGSLVELEEGKRRGERGLFIGVGWTSN